ncbi:MAG TPA: hypothetical protein VJG49_04440, partial [Candidatus Nanoarchaeia archaeon]|nr:hypothetical protein [Candidatus Nanoarchaeia archaeon]
MGQNDISGRVLQYETLTFELKERERAAEIQKLIRIGIYNQLVMKSLFWEITDYFRDGVQPPERVIREDARLEQLRKMRRSITPVDIPLSLDDLAKFVYQGIAMRLQQVGPVVDNDLIQAMDIVNRPDDHDEAIIRPESYDLLIEPVNHYLRQRRKESQPGQREYGNLP